MTSKPQAFAEPTDRSSEKGSVDPPEAGGVLSGTAGRGNAASESGALPKDAGLSSWDRDQPRTPGPAGALEEDSTAQTAALVSPLLISAGFVHAFFTRRGGKSAPPWDSLSFSTAQGDDPAAVHENRIRAARRLGVPERRLYYLSQVHGIEAQEVRGDESPDDVVRKVGDTTLSSTPYIACGVRTADCVPVLLGDRNTGAAAAVHSGWKGTLLRVVSVSVERLRLHIGGPGDLVAAIGPCISACCFEVGDDVATQLAQASSAGDSSLSWGPPSAQARLKTGSPAPTRRVDLRRIVRAQLLETGVSQDSIEDVPGCTYCEPERFHSYRRDGARSGRLLSAIVPRGT
jgi:YfiH family protein